MTGFASRLERLERTINERTGAIMFLLQVEGETDKAFARRRAAVMAAATRCRASLVISFLRPQDATNSGGHAS